MKKITHIIYSGLGGHFSVALALIEADRNRKYDHSIIFYGIEEPPASYFKKCEEEQIRFFYIKKNPGLDISSLKKILNSLKEQRPGIILLNSVNLILTVARYKLRRKVKLITIEHQSNELKTKKEWVWSVLLMQLSNKVVYLTDSYKEQMRKKLGAFYHAGKVAVINNGINIDLFKPCADWGIGSNDIKIGMLSRLTNIKDHKTLLLAFKKTIENYNDFFQVKLYIAGDGETRNDLERTVLELQLNDSVIFTGMLTEKGSADLLNRLTVYVHSSYGETMSTAIMQAMACAKPVIATDVRGISNMIEHNITGLLVPLEDTEKMYGALKSLIDDAALRKKMGMAALKYAQKNFSNTAMLAKYAKVFED